MAGPAPIPPNNDYDEAYRDGYLDALNHIEELFAGLNDDLDDWIEQKLEANE